MRVLFLALLAFSTADAIADDTERLQRLVDSAPGGTVTITSGVYRLERTLFVTNLASVRLDPTAVLKAVRPMDYVVKINHHRRQGVNLSFCGGAIDGAGIASCMALDGCYYFTLREVSFFNGRKAGLRVNGEEFGYELIANNLYFKCTMPGLAGNVAVYSTGGDSHYADCVVTDYTVGFRFAQSGGNRLTRCHVWGGLVPPKKKDALPEMLEDSVCFWIDGAHTMHLRDCYADTGKTGFLIDGYDVRMDGCWYQNNPIFKLDDVVIIDHRSGNLAVSGGHFCKDSKNVTIYRARDPFARVCWSDNSYARFASGPGACEYQVADRFEVVQDCNEADDWELLPLKFRQFDYPDGVFSGERTYDTRKVYFPARAFNAKFPKAGPGKTLVVRAKALDEVTKSVEVAFVQRDGKVWGCQVPLAGRLGEWTVPLSELTSYFGKWKGVPEIGPHDRLDVRKLDHLLVTFGKWLCPGSVDQSHSFVIESIRVVQR